MKSYLASSLWEQERKRRGLHRKSVFGGEVMVIT